MIASFTKTIPFHGDYINGQFVRLTKEDGRLERFSPAEVSDLVFESRWSYDHIEKATEAARNAYNQWRNTPTEKRIEKVSRLKEIFTERKPELSQVISRETGKPLWESEGEVQAMIAKIDITVKESLKLVLPVSIENAAPGLRGGIHFQSRGVFAVLGPFNFPGHLPNGHIIPALLTGNTVVFKPSELTPATGQTLMECFDQAEIPPGVVNLIQGDAETGKRLCLDENIDGILFTGSYETGLKIKQSTIEHHWKLLALEMGGKNSSIVWNDADLNNAIYENILGAFLTSGQRCSCTSRIMVHEEKYDEFVEAFYEHAKTLKIGHWRDNMFMGPLINETAVEKYVRFQEIAAREGATRLMRGKALELNPKGTYVTPSIFLCDDVREDSIYFRSEIFGPNVAIVKVKDLDYALKINRSTGYGLATSIFTKNEETFQTVLANARSGLVNWNKATNGASSKLPFGGFGKSGNDRPTAHFAVYYCTVPVATLEQKLTGEFHPVPGFHFKERESL